MISLSSDGRGSGTHVVTFVGGISPKKVFDYDEALNFISDILAANPKVCFYRITPLYNVNVFRFETDSEISIPKCCDIDNNTQKPKDPFSEIVHQIKIILEQPECKNSDCVSLRDLKLVIGSVRMDWANRMKKHKENLINTLKKYPVQVANDFEGMFDYKNNNLTIVWNGSTFIFAKKYGNLYCTTAPDASLANFLTSYLGDKISEYFDDWLKYRDFLIQRCCNVKPLNSNFGINIAYKEVSINYDIQDFRVTATTGCSKYEYSSISSDLANFLEGREEEIFSRIFVKIEDCPEWAKAILYEMREDQLKNEHRPGVLRQIRRFLKL